MRPSIIPAAGIAPNQESPQQGFSDDGKWALGSRSLPRPGTIDKAPKNTGFPACDANLHGNVTTRPSNAVVV